MTVRDAAKYMMDADPLPFVLQILSKWGSFSLKRAENGIDSIEDLVELALGWKFIPSNFTDLFSVKPYQVREEIVELLSIIRTMRPRRILEIGTCTGGTLYLFARIAPPDAVIFSIDLPYGPFGGGYPKWKIPLLTSFARHNQRIHLFRDDSHDPRVVENVRQRLQDNPLDFLFIDGDHTYEGVKKDFEMYSPLVRPGGVIALHDIARSPRFPKAKVNEFWTETRQLYRHQEIIHDPNQGYCGIGLIFWNPDVNRSRASLNSWGEPRVMRP